MDKLSRLTITSVFNFSLYPVQLLSHPHGRYSLEYSLINPLARKSQTLGLLPREPDMGHLLCVMMMVVMMAVMMTVAHTY